MKQKLREEISNEYKWDLEAIYKNKEEFEDELKKIEQEIDKIDKYKDILMESSSNLLECLELDTNISRRLSKAHTYANCYFDSDTGNASYQEMLGKVNNLYQKYSEKISFIEPSILKCDYNTIQKYMEESPKLKSYERNLKEIYRFKKYILSDNEEKIISNLEKALDSSSTTYESLTDTDMTYGNIIDENGESVELTDSNYNKYIKSNDRRVRKEAFDELYRVYSNFKNTICSTIKGNIEANTSIAKIRGYNSAIEASLFSDNIDVSVYNNLIDTVSNNLSSLFKYYDLKKKILGLDEMHLYDTYVSIINEKPREYTFDEAKELVKKALSVLGDKYINDLNNAFTEKWIDIYNNKGKRGGAYSGGSYDTYPYVLLNFEGTLNDVSTLAHELGHSMHSYYSRLNNSYQDSNYKIFVAEVASTVNELLLSKYLLKNTSDKREKLIILNNLLDLFKATIFRQTMFAEFEKNIYEKHEKGEILTAELLCNDYYELNKKYFGNSVYVDDEIKYEWERIPHFYYYFYVYKYATGLSAACYIVNGILSGSKDALDNYLKFLTLGGSMDPLDELKVAGIDMTKPDSILSAIHMFDEILEEFEQLYNA